MFLSCGVGEDSWEFLDCKKIKPVNPKGNEPGIFIGGLLLKLQYFGHLTQRADSLEKNLMLGKTEGKGEAGWQRIRWLDNITNSMDMHLSKLQETVEDRGGWSAVVHGVAKNGTWLSNRTITSMMEVTNGMCSSQTVVCRLQVQFDQGVASSAPLSGVGLAWLGLAPLKVERWHQLLHTFFISFLEEIRSSSTTKTSPGFLWLNSHCYTNLNNSINNKCSLSS